MKLIARFKLVDILASGYQNCLMQAQEKLGKKIQKFRKHIGITQEKFAEKVHLSRTHMGHIEQGRKSPSLKVINRIAKALNVKVKDLFS